MPLDHHGCCCPQVAGIQAEISVKQKDCENDLAKAEPSLTAATAALDTLNKVLLFIFDQICTWFFLINSI